jgi:hypothetical protein
MSTRGATYTTVVEKENVRYDAECMILHNRRSRYSGEETMLHTPLKADYSNTWRRLPGLVKNKKGIK